ncbi:MAG: polymerase [Actinomycetota bacterium]|nr:polymerase [Actinomycetota bacterium]
MTSGPPRRLFLLDGHSLAYRAFFALPPTLATSTGQVTNAVYGFTSMLIKLLGDEHPDGIAVAFDMGAPTIRLEMDAEYKAGRSETPADFSSQLGLVTEVLDALKIPVIRMEGHEADDALGTLALRAADAGWEATIVTGDRDFFQLVRPGVRVLYNRRGISDMAWFDEAAVEEKYGIPPAKYLEYVALKGDPSDNIPGVPGVGEKTAAKLIQQYGSVEELLAHTDDLRGKLKENVESHGDRLGLNKELARIVVDVDLPVKVEDCVMGTWDPEEVRRLFISLEFKSLFDRLMDLGRNVGPETQTLDVELEQIDAKQLLKILKGVERVALQLQTDDGRVVGVGVSTGEAHASFALIHGVEALEAFLSDPDAVKLTADSKALERAVISAGGTLSGVAFDAILAGYLLDASAAQYGLSELSVTYLGADVLGAVDVSNEGQLFAEDPWRATAAEAAAVALLAPVMEARIDSAGLRELFDTVELPLSSVLAKMEARGIALDIEYLAEMGESVRDRMATLKADIYQRAGEDFNLNSPPQLRKILYEKLGLQPGKKTPKGELSTDASVLEKLREEHPIVDALLSWRELDKLNSTYLEALPKLVDPRDGRVHTSFNQTVAATGRLSSSNPNLQNIPVRSELGRQIRRAFVAGEPGHVLLAADYSQIELRILAHLSGDEGLREAFETGVDIHAATAAKVFGLPLESVDQELRRRAKAVNYGLAYGMNSWGLATRLDIAPDEAQEIMEGYFEGFPGIKSYLDIQVGRATVEGFTETLLGRRRYIPELQAANPRVRDLGRRQALNAPIQGSASDVFKVAIIAVDGALTERGDLDCHILLNVHDELVFEVPEANVKDAAEIIKERMEHAFELDVPLQADIGWGVTWADAAPEGH